MEKEEDRDRIIDAVEDDTRPRPGLVAHARFNARIGIAGRAPAGARPVVE
jgi:hypothetical protein